MSDQDGGPAFPTPESFSGNHGRVFGGMSLRDWFAGQALQGGILSDTASPTEQAKTAYAYADAMLAARTPKKEEGGK